MDLIIIKIYMKIRIKIIEIHYYINLTEISSKFLLKKIKKK